MGAKSKLTPALLTKLDEIADDVWSIDEACEALKIGSTTWRRWIASPNEDEAHVAFRALAARVRAGAGEKVDELSWGTLRAVMLDPEARPSDRVAAASAALRLRTPARVEMTGKDGVPLGRGPDLSKLTPQELRTLHELTAKAEGGDA